MKILSIVSTKGGVGKTTLTANLSGYLSRLGHSVLMIDADPQPSLSSYYNIKKQRSKGLVEVFTHPQNINECISQTDFGDLIVSNDAHNGLQNWLISEVPDGRFRLKQALSFLDKKYDFVLIDTQGAKGALQDATVLVADQLITPMLVEMATIREFKRGTLAMLNNLQGLLSMGGHAPDLFVVVYKLDNTADAKKFLHVLHSAQNDQYSILDTAVPQSVVFKEATSMQMPVCDFHVGNKKQRMKSEKSYQAIKSLVKELALCA